MASFFERLTRIGILEDFDPKKTKEYRLANIYTLSAIVLMAVNAAVQSSFGLYGVAVACLIAILGLSTSFLFTARQQVFQAEIQAMASNYVGILGSVLLYGEAYWNHYYLVLLVIAYMVIFGPRYARARNWSISLTLAAFAASFFSGEGLLGAPDFPATGQLVVSRLNLFLVTLAMLIFFYASVLQNRVSEKRLAKAASRADRERQIKSNFLSVMSHEIRTPLNGILGVGHLLTKSSSREELEESVQILNTSTQLLHTLVNDILDFNKLEAGKIDLYERDFKLRELLFSTHQLFAPKASTKSLNYQFEFDERLSDQVQGDSSRINQVVSNLLSNAIKFSHEGTVVLRAKLIQQTAESDTVQIEVEDEGIGIVAAKQQEIFDEFRQAGSSTSVLYGGTGLGLAICKKIIELLGSEIQVESQEGRGSRFYFQLELKRCEVQESSISPDREPRTDQLQGVRLLLVEDNAVNQLIMRKFFAQWKVNYRLAGNGQEALDILEEESFDLVLMDIQMPVMNGLEASLQIRSRNQPYQHIPIIALTADVTNDLRTQALEVGINAVVTKPFQPDELYQMIQQHLRTKGKVFDAGVNQTVEAAAE